MNDIQSKQLELLIELNNICREYDIKYSLSAPTYGYAELYGVFDERIQDPQILMTVDDMCRFIKIVEGGILPGRTVEYMGNSKNFNQFACRYVNEETTLLRLGRGTDFAKNGIAVNILPLRKKRKLNKILTGCESGWEGNGYRLTSRLTVKNILAVCFIRAFMIIGKGNLAKILFRKFCKAYKGANEETQYVLREYKRKRITLKSFTFDEHRTVSLEGYDFCVADNIEEIINRVRGKAWRDKFDSRKINMKYTICLSDTPYSELMQSISKSGVSYKGALKKQRIASFYWAYAAKKLNYLDRAWTVAKRSGDRLLFAEFFRDNIDTIKYLRENNLYDELEVLLEEYDRVTKSYLRRNLGFTVDAYTLQLECEILCRRGDYKSLSKLRKLVPKKHLMPIIDIQDQTEEEVSTESEDEITDEELELDELGINDSEKIESEGTHD